MKNIQISVRHYFDVEDIKGLLDSASRGSAYWCENELAYESETNKAVSGVPSSTLGAKYLECSQITETEHESGAPIVHFLNLDKIKKGLRIFAKKYPTHFSDFLTGNYDQDTGDVFLQTCLFGIMKYQ